MATELSVQMNQVELERDFRKISYHLIYPEKQNGRTPDWYLAFIKAAYKYNLHKELGSTLPSELPFDNVKAIFEEGVRRFPDFTWLYFQGRLYRLRLDLPQDTDEFARYICQLIGNRGFEPYTRLWWSVEFRGTQLFAPGKADWNTFRQGFEEMMKRYPDSQFNLSYFLRFARIADDKVTGRKLLAKLGDAPPMEPFLIEARRLEVEAWANDQAPYGEMKWSVPITKVDAVAWKENGVAWARDGKTIYVGLRQSGVTLVDPATGEFKGNFDAGVESTAMAVNIDVSPDGSLIAAVFGHYGSQHSSIPCCVWDEKGDLVTLFKPESGSFFSLKFNERNELLVGGWRGDGRSELWQWSRENGATEINAFKRHGHPFYALAWLPNNGRLFNCSKGRLHLWDGNSQSATWTQATVPDQNLETSDMDVSPDHQSVAIALGKSFSENNMNQPIGGIGIFNALTGEARTDALSPLTGSMETVAYSPDGKFIACGGQDGFLYFMSAETLEIKHWWNMEVGIIRNLAWSPDGQSIAVTSNYPDRLWLWNLH